MPNLTVNTSFSDLVGPNSIFLFKNLGLDVEFLKLPVTKWITDPSYSSNIEILKGFKVVNDLAERGVRLAHDFKNSARNEEHYQNVLQTVEFSRNHVQNLRCKKKKKEYDPAIVYNKGILVKFTRFLFKFPALIFFFLWRKNYGIESIGYSKHIS